MRETLVYIEPTSVSMHQNEHSCAGLMNFALHNDVISVMVSTFNSIESFIVYRNDVDCTTYKTFV